MKPIEQVLLYHLQSAEKEQAYCSLLSSLSIPYSIVDPQAADNTLGSLLHRSGFPAPILSESTPLAGELMILSGFTELRLNTLLSRIRGAGLEPIALKAVVTPTNIHWTLKKLFGHLLLEHMQMTGGRS